jgi:hypothetical protein
MWGGKYMAIEKFSNGLYEDFMHFIKRPQDLLGLSTYLDYEDYEINNKDLASKSYCKEVKLIGENNKLWKRINVWDEAIKYFKMEKTNFVKYSDYLLNHTKKLAVDLKDYFEQSKFLSKKKDGIAIDLLPALTETGGGLMMAFSDGASFETTEELDGAWCGDLLQIVDKLPKEYEVINCCFADIWSRAEYYYQKLGADKDGYILKNEAGEKYKCVVYNLLQQRSPARYVKAVEDEKGIEYVTEKCEKAEADNGGL